MIFKICIYVVTSNVEHFFVVVIGVIGDNPVSRDPMVQKPD